MVRAAQGAASSAATAGKLSDSFRELLRTLYALGHFEDAEMGRWGDGQKKADERRGFAACKIVEAGGMQFWVRQLRCCA